MALPITKSNRYLPIAQEFNLERVEISAAKIYTGQLDKRMAGVT